MSPGRRWAAATVTAGLAALLAPTSAVAHGVSQRADLPIPQWLFTWGAGVVLIASFVALAALWPRPKLENDGWRPLLRLPGVALVEAACGAIGVAALVLVVYSGLRGVQVASANLAPTLVYVVVWVGFVFASAPLGDVFRAFNPWRAVGRALGALFSLVTRRPAPAPLPYPERVGRWPAVAAIAVFAWLELASQNGDLPRTVALGALAYSAITFVGMALYGVEAWIERGEGFSVYFNLFARISPLERRGARLGVRRPLSGLADLDAAPGTVALLAVMIGTVTFDGASEGALWANVAFALQARLEGIVSPSPAAEIAATAGLAVAVALIYALYRLAAAGVQGAASPTKGRPAAGAFVHSLVPIALAYVAAHYLTLLAFQGQALAYLVSDPLGSGADIFGTAARSIDYRLIGANAIWYAQVAFVVVGHVAGLTLAHDRALVLYGETREAARSQLPMLAVMVAFTTLALWLLSQANA